MRTLSSGVASLVTAKQGGGATLARGNLKGVNNHFAGPIRHVVGAPTTGVRITLAPPALTLGKLGLPTLPP